MNNNDKLSYTRSLFGDITLFIENYKKKKITILQCTKEHWYLEKKLDPCIKCNCVKSSVLSCGACGIPLCFECSTSHDDKRIYCSKECHESCLFLLSL
jgi:hypothetical protein